MQDEYISLVERYIDDAVFLPVEESRKKKLSDLADGATYALTVENEERHIFIGYRITEGYTHMGLMWKKDTHAELLPAIDVNDTEALAFDHAYILNTALDRLEEMQKEYREQLE